MCIYEYSPLHVINVLRSLTELNGALKTCGTFFFIEATGIGMVVERICCICTVLFSVWELVAVDSSLELRPISPCSNKRILIML